MSNVHRRKLAGRSPTGHSGSDPPRCPPSPSHHAVVAGHDSRPPVDRPAGPVTVLRAVRGLTTPPPTSIKMPDLSNPSAADLAAFVTRLPTLDIVIVVPADAPQEWHILRGKPAMERVVRTGKSEAMRWGFVHVSNLDQVVALTAMFESVARGEFGPLQIGTMASMMRDARGNRILN
jgi:hypothetical protein